jgi:hypothetical protein
VIPTREELEQTIDVAEWGWLRAHLERGGLIVVTPLLDLADAGVKVASDDAATIGRWIEAGNLAKPSAEQIEEWNVNPARRFRILVVSPYVLMQETPADMQ